MGSGRDTDEHTKRVAERLRRTEPPMSVRAIAKELRLSPTTVQKILKKDIAK